MRLLSLFHSASNKNTPSIFEREFLQLELRITSQQNKLNTINNRLNCTLPTISRYILLLWFFYSLLWYSRHHPINPLALIIQKLDQSSTSSIQSFLVLPVILTPLGLQSFRWIFQAYYRRQEEIQLIELRLIKKQLRDKVEEVKKKTAYYSTKELLDRYDDQADPTNVLPNNLTPNQPGRKEYSTMNGSSAETLLRQRNRVASSSTVKSNNPTDQMESPSTFSPAQQLNPQLPPASPTSQHQQTCNRLDSCSPTPPPSSSKRGWADRVAEALLGNDEAGPESKYALICKYCLAHNGLVREEELDLIKYICPKCGTFNPSRNPQSIQRSGGGEGSRERSNGEEENGMMKMKAVGGTNMGARYQQLEPYLGGGGRKSLGGPVMRNKPSNDSFNLVEKQRAASHGNPGSFVSTCNSIDDLASLQSNAIPPTDDDQPTENPVSPTPSSISPSPIPPTTPSKQSNSRSKSKKKNN